jgi:large subunit ribosomal protein L5
MPATEAKIVPRLKQRYEQEVAPRLFEQFGYSSRMQTPRLVKITLNMGVGDAKQDTNMLQASARASAARASRSRTSSSARRCPWAWP